MLSITIFSMRVLRNVASRRVNTTVHMGLLQGIEDVSKAKYYSQNMDLNLAVAMMKDKKYIYNAALKDCEVSQRSVNEYLLSCSSKAVDFIMSNDVWDREELTAVLSPVYERAGYFVCLLGGKNTGKSFLLNLMAKTQGPRSCMWICANMDRTLNTAFTMSWN